MRALSRSSPESALWILCMISPQAQPQTALFWAGTWSMAPKGEITALQPPTLSIWAQPSLLSGSLGGGTSGVILPSMDPVGKTGEGPSGLGSSASWGTSLGPVV